MEKLHFSIIINESREKVWHTMLDDAPYREWTAVFNPGGSWYEGKWETGADMRFLGPDIETGNVGGMISRIKEARPFEFISIEHVGMIVNGVDDYTSNEVKKWSPAFENYTFNELGNSTEVVVDQDIESSYKAQFEDLWQKALQKLKEIAEKK